MPPGAAVSVQGSPGATPRRVVGGNSRIVARPTVAPELASSRV